jgi:hypothetical protein
VQVGEKQSAAALKLVHPTHLSSQQSGHCASPIRRVYRRTKADAHCNGVTVANPAVRKGSGIPIPCATSHCGGCPDVRNFEGHGATQYVAAMTAA